LLPSLLLLLLLRRRRLLLLLRRRLLLLLFLVAGWLRLRGQRWCWWALLELLLLLDAPRCVAPCRPTTLTCLGPQAARLRSHLGLENGAGSAVGAAALRSAPGGGGGGGFASGREKTREGVRQASQPLLLLLSVRQRPHRVET